MEYRCSVCQGTFADPAALGAHRAYKCQNRHAGLPAVLRKNLQHTEDLDWRTAGPSSSSKQPAKRARSSAADSGGLHRAEEVGELRQADAQVGSAGVGPPAGGDFQRFHAQVEENQAAGASQSGLPDPSDNFEYFELPESDHEYVQPLPSDLRDTRSFVEWIRSCNQNRGLPDADVEAFFALHRSGFNSDNLKVHNAKDVKNFEVNHLFLEKDGWKKHVFTREGDPYEIAFHLRDPEQALRSLLSRSANATGFAYHPEVVKDPVSGERRVSTPQTAVWCENAQKYIDIQCLGAVIAALILYSDQTSLSNDQRVGGWDLVLSLANIAFEKRADTDGHVLFGVVQILKAVPGHPGFEPDSDSFRTRIRDNLQESLAIGLRVLKDLSFSGLVALDPNGANQTFYPLLYSYVCDHPEGCKVTCTKDSNRTRCPCSVCLVLSSQLNDVGTKHDLRTRQFMEGIFDEPDPDERERQAMLYSVHLGEKPAIYGFNGDGEDWNQPHDAVQVDILHQSDIGVFPMLIDAVISASMGSSHTRLAREIEANLMEIRRTCRFADLRIPGSDKGGYLTSRSRSKFAAFEHRGIMQVIVFALIGHVETKYIKCVVGFLEWYMKACRAESFTRSELDDLDAQAKTMVDRIVRVLGDSQASEFGTVKVHAISHFTRCIWRSGVPKHYSANLYESLHSQLLKIGYRASNRRDAIEWAIFHHRRLCALRELAGLDEIDELVDDSPVLPGNETALYKAMRSGRNELSGVSLTLRLEWLETISIPGGPAFGVVSKHAAELLEKQDELRCLYPELKAFLGDDFARISAGKVHVHTAMAIPPGSSPRGAKRAMYARATPSFFKLPWYSNLVIKAEGPGEAPRDWYAEVRLFVSCNLTRYDGPDDLREMALVRYYDELPAPDVVTGCRRLRWERPENQFRVVSTQSILRLEHVVPDFSTEDGFFINRFLFEH